MKLWSFFHSPFFFLFLPFFGSNLKKIELFFETRCRSQHCCHFLAGIFLKNRILQSNPDNHPFFDMSEEGDVKSNIGEDNCEPSVEEDDERLKGDAIGDTLYSESWVLKTLMKLTRVKLYFINQRWISVTWAYSIIRNYQIIQENLIRKVRMQLNCRRLLGNRLVHAVGYDSW